MKNILAITILIFGLAGGALAQDYSNPSDAPLKADILSTSIDNNDQQNEASEKSDCKGDQQPSSTQQDPAQAPEQAAQNVIEYGG